MAMLKVMISRYFALNFAQMQAIHSKKNNYHTFKNKINLINYRFVLFLHVCCFLAHHIYHSHNEMNLPLGQSNLSQRNPILIYGNQIYSRIYVSPNLHSTIFLYCSDEDHRLYFDLCYFPKLSNSLRLKLVSCSFIFYLLENRNCKT